MPRKTTISTGGKPSNVCRPEQSTQMGPLGCLSVLFSVPKFLNLSREVVIFPKTGVALHPGQRQWGAEAEKTATVYVSSHT